MCCYELLTGLPAWYTSDRRKLFDRIRSSTSEAATVGPSRSGRLRRGVAPKASEAAALRVNGADELRGEAFFASVDFDALVLGALDPPIQPCSRLSRPAHRANFDGRFTTLPGRHARRRAGPGLPGRRRRARYGLQSLCGPNLCKFIAMSLSRRGGGVLALVLVSYRPLACACHPQLRQRCASCIDRSFSSHVTAHPPSADSIHQFLARFVG